MGLSTCPRCGESATIGKPFTLRSVTGVEQTYQVVRCVGRCLLENGPSPRGKGHMTKEFRFRHAVAESITNEKGTGA